MGAVPVDPSTPSLAGRTAVVTGGAQGIGAAIALAFAAYGADVAVCDRNERPGHDRRSDRGRGAPGGHRCARRARR